MKKVGVKKHNNKMAHYFTENSLDSWSEIRYIIRKTKMKMRRREIVHVYLISERGCLVQTLMKKTWKASWSSGVNKVASDGEFHR